MLQEFLSHRFAYLTLIAGLIVFVGFFLWLWPNREAIQALILILLSSYVLWGCLVHTKSKHLTAQIMLEYIAVAAFAGACLHVILL